VKISNFWEFSVKLAILPLRNRKMTPAEKAQSIWKETTKGYAWVAMVGGTLILLVIGIVTLAQIVIMANVGQDM